MASYARRFIMHKRAGRRRLLRDDGPSHIRQIKMGRARLRWAPRRWLRAGRRERSSGAGPSRLPWLAPERGPASA